jgi:hypothetical protein
MARDYRYGHKTKKPTTRRTQEHKEGKLEATLVSKQEDIKQVVEQAGDKNRNKTAQGEHVEPSAHARVAQEKGQETQDKINGSEKQTAQQAVTVKGKRIRYKANAERSIEMQRIVDAACRLSLPKAIRKEVEEKEALARQQAEVLAAEQKKAQQQAQLLAQKKKQTRVSWGIWGSLTLIIFSSVVWLLYAPFFLAFALKMNWIDQATHDRLDPAASLRSQVVANMPQNDQQANVTSTLTTKQAESELLREQNSGVTYSFYHELPKASIVTGAQPLPVRTRSPTYLQLVSMNNEKEAQAERKRLAQKGYLVQMNAQVTKGQNVYVLRMGPFEDQRIINRLKVELQRLGIDAREISVASVVKAIDRQLPETPPVSPSRGEMQQHQKTTP